MMRGTMERALALSHAGVFMSAPSGFQLSGSAPEAYQRYGVPALGTAKAQDLVALATLQAGERVLDVACGTGVVTRQAAQAVGTAGQVIGLDINEGMLQVARTVVPPAGAPIIWHHGSVMALPFPEASFDVVLCQWGLEFFPDRAQGLREMARVLVPGGRVGLRVWRALARQPFQTAVLAALDRHVFDGQNVPSRAALVQPFSLADAEAVRALLAGAGFHDIRVRIGIHTLRFASAEAYTQGFLSASPIASEIAAMDGAARTRMMQEIVAALHPFVDDDGLAAPAEDHVVLARK
jgi:ubiquinone/menaquinone biosynthesis C-methylase UbiE